MSEIKGYVVRGFDRRGHPVSASWCGDVAYDGAGAPSRFDSVEAATEAVVSLRRLGCTDIRIFVVHAAGPDTPLPTYEDALAEIGRLGSVKDRLADERDDEHAEVLRLRTEQDGRDKAWARLVRAEVACAASGYGIPSDDAVAEYEAARQALRDLGVDVDALLGDT